MARLFHLFKKILFWFSHGRKFHKFPFDSMVLDPLRIQGHKYISIGKGVYIHKFVWLGAYQRNSNPQLIIGDGSCIGNFNHFTCLGKLELGKKVLTADKVFITDNLHSYSNHALAILDQEIVFVKDVTIGDGAWLGENVAIIGASVGKNSVIGANSVVTRDIPDYCVAVGAPARVIKKFNHITSKWESINS